MKGLNPNFKYNYLRLIAAGYTESTALLFLEVEWLDFFETCSKDLDFVEDVKLAREARADQWVDRIAESIHKKYYIQVGDGPSIERPPTATEIQKDKLDFEKLKFLAQADNPDRYASTGVKAKVQVDVDLTTIKLLSPQDALKVLRNDPFNKQAAIEATSTVVEEKDAE